MATIKALHGSKSLKNAIDYVTNPEKAEVITSVNCNVETAFSEMETTKNMYGKTGGRTYIHLVQSWHKDEDFFADITEEQKEKIAKLSDEEQIKIKAKIANEIAQKMIKELPLFKGYEVIIATHIDREHIHNHIIVNSVNFENGYKFQSSAHDLQVIKDKSDEICLQYGLSKTEKGKTFEGLERDETSTYNKEARWVQEQAEKKNIKSYIRDVGIAVLKARDKADSKETFIKFLTENNIGVVWSDTRKNITFVDRQREKLGEKKYKVRDKTLNEYFGLNVSKEELENGFTARIRTAEIRRNSDERTDTDNRTINSREYNTESVQREIDATEQSIARIRRKRKEEKDRERAIKEREQQSKMATKTKPRQRSQPTATNRGYGR